MTLLAIVGPTASGEDPAAVHLAQRYGAEIVGVDASQVYRGLNIGTGKATASELDGVAHHMLDLVDPDEPFDAAEFSRRARRVVDNLVENGRRVILCGGTGLYLRALLYGLCEAPAVDPWAHGSVPFEPPKG